MRTVYALLSRVGLLLVAVVGTVAGVGWHLANVGQPLGSGVTDWWLMPVVAAVAYAGTGGWLTRRRPDLPIGWLLLAVGAGSAIYAACLEYSLWVLARDPAAEPAGAAFWVANWLWVTVLLTIAALLPQLLPDGRPLGGRWQAALILGGTAVAAQTLVWALTP